MGFRRYAEYRDSGVEWIGKIPMGWAVKPLKFTATINDDTLLENTDPDFEFDYVDIGSVDYVEGISSKEIMTFESAPSRARRIVKSGDTIVSTVRTYLRAIASIGEFDKPLIVSTGFAVVRPKTVYAEFLAYTLKASFFVQSIVARSVGVSYPAVNASEVGNIFVPVPSEKEQTVVATFLDRETAKIDGLIEKQEHLIEFLREKRQAVVSHAVTKGLNPNAKMKDSGVEWLGEVPNSWVIGHLRWFISIASGDGLSNSQFSKVLSEEDCYRVIGGNGTFGYSKYFNTIQKAFAVGRVGALCGNVHFLKEKCWINDNSLKISEWYGFNDLYFEYLLKAANLNQYASQSAQPLITSEHVKSLKVPIPPSSEQVKIATFLEREIAKIDMLIERCETAIELLKERRTALISAAVTGKIDVRSAV